MFLVLSIISCDKDESNADSDQIEISAFGDSEKSKCIDLVYPASFELPDGTLVTEESQESLKETVKAYIETNNVDRFRPHH